MYYVNSLFTVPRGQLEVSNTLVSNGSNIPLSVQLYHIYDSTGKIVDDLFSKTYPVTTWKLAYNSTTDTNYNSIIAKLTTQELPSLVIGSGGTVTATSATLNIPSGTYTLDLKVTNVAGEEILKNAMQLQLTDPVLVETNDATTGTYGIGIAKTGLAAVTYIYNAANCPFIQMSVNRYADTPNVLTVKFVDKNGVPFNPKTEIFPRPGVIQNLQYYQPDTYIASDTAMTIKYPITPYPVASKGNAYLWYYNIKTSAVKIDSTSAWSSNSAGIYYQGTSDPHYLGTYQLGEYDLSYKVSARIQVPGSYIVTWKILNATHR